MKKFKTLKEFTIFFTVVTILAFASYFLLSSKGTQEGVLNLLLNLDSTLTKEALADWANWAILAALISGILQLIFMIAAFNTAKGVITETKSRMIQTSVYMGNSKEEKRMKKEAFKTAKKDEKVAMKKAKVEAKEAKKIEKITIKEAKKVAPVKVEKVVEVKKESTEIDDILANMK